MKTLVISLTEPEIKYLSFVVKNDIEILAQQQFDSIDDAIDLTVARRVLTKLNFGEQQ